MAKKNSKNTSWICRHGCPLTKEPCKHLEKKLGKGNGKGMQRPTSQSVILEHLDNMHCIDSGMQDDSNLVKFLYEYGLQEHEVELLMDRYISNLPLVEIAEKHGYLNRQEVWRLLQDTTQKLKRSTLFKGLLVTLIKESVHEE